ncbi:alpha/beta fold hydrolase [Ketobacter sp.]|uniref:alpha/beta fold hydrolase n=1 Tax=Ketobacter sp. TaxID=2083498 RepID=UPI0025C4B281|nr:alpha/beta fold hydrolase [Ketobacter sp.]
MSVRKVETSLMVPLPGGHQLHLRRLADNPDGAAVLLLHGLLEDGTIFYSRQGRGLAHFLAEQGFDTYIPDLRGKGRSWPPVSRWAAYRVEDAVNQDIPAILDTIHSHKGAYPAFWITHAWGGVLASSYLARYPGYRASLNGLINFGSHRVAVHRSVSRYMLVEGLWGWCAQLAARFKGYVPGRSLKIGAENEFLGIQRDSLNWFRGQDWVDPVDQFDYGAAISQGLSFPPALYFAPSADLARCSAADVKGFMREIGHHNGRLVVLGRNLGNRHNYSQISMLTHPDAVQDHFPFMVNWMLEMNKLREEAQSGDGPEQKNQGHSTASGK